LRLCGSATSDHHTRFVDEKAALDPLLAET